MTEEEEQSAIKLAAVLAKDGVSDVARVLVKMAQQSEEARKIIAELVEIVGRLRVRLAQNIKDQEQQRRAWTDAIAEMEALRAENAGFLQLLKASGE